MSARLGLERPSCAPHVELEVASKMQLRRPASRESESWASSHWPCDLSELQHLGGRRVPK